jgi:hypothetical protein
LFGGSVKTSGTSYDNVASKQYIKLFLPPDVDVRPGSRIDVTKAGQTISLKSSTRVFMYPSHQEIIIESKEDFD